MKISGAALWCLGYIVGLLSLLLVYSSSLAVNWSDVTVLSLTLMVMGLIAALVMPRLWRMGPRFKPWLATGIIATVAVVHMQLRLPQPSPEDISHHTPTSLANEPELIVTVAGKVTSLPTLTRSGRLRFWLQAQQFNELQAREGINYTFQPVEGKLYVTVPLLQGTGIYPGQQVKVTGSLYQPTPALNPGGFDFQAYLARRGAFCALKGQQIIPESGQTPSWRFWQLRRRIIRSQMRWLGSPVGQVVSSIVLGRRAVDLPYPVRDEFIQAGLAHVLAASGFHISLLLGVVLTLSQRLPSKGKLNIGVLTLIIYICLTGFQPSVLRAALMGLGALIALVTERQVKPLGSLLLAATILLIINPLWIEDLGFQLSFLATLGLIVTVPAITKNLDWLPPAIASVVAVPVAATVWTLPLMIHVFAVVAPYSIPTNILVTPLIALISLGGMVSAMAALIYPPVGSAIAWLLYYPTQLLIQFVHLVNHLPGSSWALGSISLAQMLGIYGLIILVWLTRKLQRWWWWSALLALSIVLVPILFGSSALVQITVLATKQEPVIVIQSQGKTILINSGDQNTANFTVLPFLQQQGINHLDWAIALEDKSNYRSGWNEILARLPTPQIFHPAVTQATSLAGTNTLTYQPLPLGETLTTAGVAIKLISEYSPTLLMDVGGQIWLLLGHNQPSPAQARELVNYWQQTNYPTPAVVVGSSLQNQPNWLEQLKPQVVILSGSQPQEELTLPLKPHQTQVYWTGRDGAIKWSVHGGFSTTRETF